MADDTQKHKLKVDKNNKPKKQKQSNNRKY